MRLRLQKEIAQFIGRITAILILPSNGYIKANGESGKILCAVGIAKIHQLIKL